MTENVGIAHKFKLRKKVSVHAPDFLLRVSSTKVPLFPKATLLLQAFQNEQRCTQTINQKSQARSNQMYDSQAQTHEKE